LHFKMEKPTFTTFLVALNHRFYKLRLLLNWKLSIVVVTVELTTMVHLKDIMRSTKI
jgi:hypothetical protein